MQRLHLCIATVMQVILVSKVHADLIGETDMQFSGNEALAAESLLNTDVLFLCAGHGEAKKFLEANAIPAHIKIIDLSNDFRLAKNAEFHQPTDSHHTFIRNFVYGLPELNKEALKQLIILLIRAALQLLYS